MRVHGKWTGFCFQKDHRSCLALLVSSLGVPRTLGGAFPGYKDTRHVAFETSHAPAIGARLRACRVCVSIYRCYC
ncbi:hypothetical protein BDP27DRAFT_1337494 [Rhodocollybia butyracea]|uniref:Uncharacterized protein n=1 Tax=Rhodocollybia butyracea TaxID=206335 RepID=A0A9P5U0W4_9AGAR|nr:hypothetical protein BDP27DRAFT_1337494 [Rhodocollybia butyracea]